MVSMVKNLVLFSKTEISPQELFKNMSVPDGSIWNGYNAGIEIDSGSYFFSKFAIYEITKRKLHPFHLHQDDKCKQKTADNLASLVNKYARQIATDSIPETDAAQIVRVLERYKETQTASMQDEGVQEKTQEAYQKAIKALKSEMKKQNYLEIRQNLVGKTQWEPEQFVRKLAKSSFIGRPNFQFHLKLEQDRSITPYTSRKLFWVEKLIYGKATSAIEKKATIQNLDKLLTRWSTYIRHNWMDAGEIAVNLERLAGRMTRNMTEDEKGEIDVMVKSLTTRLEHLQKQIDGDRTWNLFFQIWRGIKWTAFAPFNLIKLVAWDKGIYPLAKYSVTGLYSLGSWAVSPLRPVAKLVHSFVLEGYEGIKDIVSYPVKKVKEVVSPKIEMARKVAEKVSYVVKAPIRQLNYMRQVTS